ncbi:UNVERIFIED_CONTAM: hypothetical protein GTU68_012094 [Idotea baltica]|nr:hypothetical protein [Idotea baltica]
MPKQIDDYIHRIGRTARANKSGTSVSFLTNDDVKVSEKLIDIL